MVVAMQLEMSKEWCRENPALLIQKLTDFVWDHPDADWSISVLETASAFLVTATKRRKST